MAHSKRKPVSPGQLAIQAAQIAADRHCSDIAVLDLRGISPVTDYFVIFTGTSDRQMRAVGNEITDAAAAAGHRLYHAAGTASAQWILLDFVDVVVHLFDSEHRSYYDLELIWGDAPRVSWRRASGKGPTKRRSAS